MGEGGVVTDYSQCRFWILPKIAVLQIYLPFVKIPIYLQKKSKTNLPLKNLGGGDWEVGRGGSKN